MILRTLTIASLLLACGALPAQKIDATGETPAPLKIRPLLPKSESMIRWFGPKGGRPEGEIGRSQWTPDGTRLFTSGLYGSIMEVQIWNASDDRKTLSLEGSLPTGENWAISPDGRHIVGRRVNDLGHFDGLQMHNLETLEGVWMTPARTPQMLRSAFSKDGKWLAVFHYQPRTYPPTGLDTKQDFAVTILEAQTGKQVKLILLERHNSDFTPHNHVPIAFSSDALWLAPVYNEDGQTTRFSIGDWKKTLVTEPAPPDVVETSVTISADDKWIVLWGRGKYRATQVVDNRLATRFEGETEYSDFAQGFTNAQISPDSRLLTISGNNRYKVVDLEERKAVHEDAKQCLCGSFSPDGAVFMGTCNPFRPFDTRTWTTPERKNPGNMNDVELVAFSPDGKLLATHDAESIYLWSVDGTAPTRKLVSGSAGRQLRALEWKPDGTEVWSADGMNFIKWRLSKTVPPGTPQASEVLFPGRKSEETPEAYDQTIRAIPGGDLCYLTVEHRGPYNYGYQIYEEVRSPGKPAVFKPSMAKGLINEHQYFSTSGEEIFYSPLRADSTLTAVKWADGTERKGMSTLNMRLAGGGINCPLILTSLEEITLADPTTLQPIRKIVPPRDTYFGDGLNNHRGSVSPDGQWFVCSGRSRRVALSKSLYLINLKENAEVYALPATDNKATCGAFSPDGHLLALGHKGGGVSLWDVEKIKKSSEPLITEKPKSSSGTGRRFTSEMWKWPGPGLPLTKGDRFEFTDYGGVESQQAGTSAGRFSIQGKLPKAVGRMLRALIPESGTAEACIGDLELRSDDGKIRINRSMNASVTGTARLLDTVENISPEAVTVEFQYADSLGCAFEELRTQESKAPQLLPDGSMKSNAPITTLTALTEKDGFLRKSSIAFSTPSAEIQPTIQWNAQGQRFIIHWSFKLQPFEKRMLMTELAQSRVKSSETPALPKLALNSPGLLPRANALLNVAAEPMEKILMEQNMFPQYGLAKDGTKEDQLGFKWRPDVSVGFGMGAEMGADRFFDMWLDGSPAMGSQPSLSLDPKVAAAMLKDLMPNNSKPKAPPRPCFSPNGIIKATRRQHWAPETGTLMVHDEISNTGTEPAAFQVMLNTVALDHFTQVMDPKGQPLDCTEPVDLKKSGGQYALLSAGSTKPALLLSVGNPSAKAVPSVKLVAGRGFFIIYDLKLEPGETTSLMHLATQRPLSAYDNTSSAFSELDSTECLKSATEKSWPVPANW